MHEWTGEIVYKAPPPAPDPERYKGCGMVAFAMFVATMASIIIFGALFVQVIR